MRILVIGISGMLGSAVFKLFAEHGGYELTGTIRSESTKQYFPVEWQQNINAGIDILDEDSLTRVVGSVKPDVVINCVGLIKQLATANDPLIVLPVNSMYPHRLAAICESSGARLIHISTDCVFDGSKGNYVESDRSDATDLYGKSKYIGEVNDKPGAITLRTSIIGHELSSRDALIEWFLSQNGSINGFTRAIFSGLPTVELARVMMDYVIPRAELHGLYHVSAAPISKFDLLSLVANIYGKKIEIIPQSEFIIDRSLNSERFQTETGYSAPDWPVLVEAMKNSKLVIGA
ncbi:SDR family oxidoreductase [Gammaproteobacteria bacterium]|nr:SDR family oxidoreductase [Gammaproteobacteria bacterium]